MKHILWDSQRISDALKRPIELPEGIYDISIDSKTTKAGDMFFGISGINHNGSNFSYEAIQNGAVACVVNHIPNNCSHIPQSKFIIVDDVHNALIEMGNFVRHNFYGNIIGITGSVGKTNTAAMLKLALSEGDRKVFANNNKNNIYGVPFSLCKMHQNTDIGIFELGMSSIGEIQALSNIVRPHISIITNIQESHLMFFDDIRQIAIAKSEIYDGTVPGGHAIINLESQHFELLIEKAKFRGLNIVTTSYMNEKIGDVRLLEYKFIHSGPLSGCTFVRASCYGEEVEYYIGTIGFHFVANSLTILALAHVLNLDHNKVIDNLRLFSAIEGRGNLIYLKNNITLIDESYNASPTSVKCCLERLANYRQEKGRIIAILGDMKELGKDEVQLHIDLLQTIKGCKIDKVFTVGNLMKHLFLKLPQEMMGISTESSEEMSNEIHMHIQAGDAIVVKGSNSVKMKKVVTAISESYKA